MATKIIDAPSVSKLGGASPVVSIRAQSNGASAITLGESTPSCFLTNHPDGVVRVSISKVTVTNPGQPDETEVDAVSQTMTPLNIDLYSSIDDGLTWQKYKSYTSLGEFNELYMALTPLQWKIVVTSMAASSYVRIRMVPLQVRYAS